MNYHIVIGANFGDEGKGLMTDYLVREHSINRVVRFNGGCQAGHTVQDDGHRHIFSNWGSGTLAGAVTELSNEVILNPYHALNEYETFLETPPKISIRSKPIITTPIEMKFNQLIEEQRGVNRHGSCGLGINETVTRHLEMVSRGISDDIRVPRALDWLVKSWIPERGAALGLSSEVIKELINQTPDLINVFVNCWAEALDVVYKLPTKDIKEDVIYEGAQGLALDETNGIFPYVTRSNTGIQNALRDILRRSKALEDTNPNVSIYYMTRTYTTRHGAGPLIGEASPLEIVGKEFGTGSFIDPTNKPNPWQGTLRFAPLDMYGIQFRINHDLMSNATLLKHVKYKANVCITCMDQSDSVKVKTGYRNPATVVNVEDIPGLFKQAGLNVSHLSFGPTANNVEEVIYA